MSKFGYTPNHEETDWILGDPEVPGVYGMGPSDSARMEQEWSEDSPLLLTDALIALEPKWKRGAQKIGDCVSWGWELAATIATAVDIVMLESLFVLFNVEFIIVKDSFNKESIKLLQYIVDSLNLELVDTELVRFDLYIIEFKLIFEYDIFV